MSVMSALVFSVLVGLAVTWTKADRTAELLEEFQKIVSGDRDPRDHPVSCRSSSPAPSAALAYEGTITRQLPVFLKVIIIVMIGHFLWMALLYRTGRCLLRKESAGGRETLWSGLHHCCRNHVLRGNLSLLPLRCARKSSVLS